MNKIVTAVFVAVIGFFAFFAYKQDSDKRTQQQIEENPLYSYNQVYRMNRLIRADSPEGDIRQLQVVLDKMDAQLPIVTQAASPAASPAATPRRSPGKPPKVATE
jgi:hypothetical protein